MRQNGDRRFEDLALDYVEPMYRLAYARVGNAEDAQDIVQETFLKAYKSFNSFSNDASLKTWITRILINTTCDHFRKRSRSVSTVDMSFEVEVEIQSTDPNPEELLCEFELEPAILEALRRIPEQFLLPLILREIDNNTYEEIASLLEIPKGTVMSRLSRARNMLRKNLKEIESKKNIETGTGR